MKLLSLIISWLVTVSSSARSPHQTIAVAANVSRHSDRCSTCTTADASALHARSAIYASLAATPGFPLVGVALGGSFASAAQLLSAARDGGVTELFIVHPWWGGVRRATMLLGRPWLEVPVVDEERSLLLLALLSALQAHGLRTVVFSGVIDGSPNLAKLIRCALPEVSHCLVCDSHQLTLIYLSIDNVAAHCLRPPWHLGVIHSRERGAPPGRGPGTGVCTRTQR
jgi:hypothetical protein